MYVVRTSVACALCIGSWMFCFYVIRAHHGAPAVHRRLSIPASADIGDRICVPGIDFSRSVQTLLIVTEDSCGACSASSALFSELAKQAVAHNIPILNLRESKKGGSQRLAPNTSRFREVSIRLPEIGIRRVPTIVMVDSNGLIRKMLTGKVPDGSEAKEAHDFFNASGRNSTPLRSIDMRQLSSLAAGTVQVIDPVPKGEPVTIARLPGAILIPFDELAIRAPYEIDSSMLTVIDCRTIAGLDCQNIQIALQNRGFTRVAGLGIQPMGSSPSCQ